MSVEVNGFCEPLLEEYSVSNAQIRSASNSGEHGTSVNEAAISVVNIILGIGLLSMPYAMNMAGWAGLASVVLCTLLFCMSGKIMTWGLECIPEGSAHSYPELGRLAFGTWGKNAVMTIAAFELFGGSCLIMMVVWKELQLLVPQWVVDKTPLSSLPFVCLLSIVVEIPLIAAGSFKKLSMFSFMGCLTTIVTTVLVLGLAFLDPHRTSVPETPSHGLIHSGLPIATGIFALSVAGHSTFPSVRNSMAQPLRFHAALHRAYAGTACILLTISGVGYWYWGSLAHQLITTDFEEQSPYRKFYLFTPGLGVQKLLEVLVLVNAVSTFPMLILSLQDMACSVMLPEVQSGSEKARRSVEALIRFILLLVVCAVGYRGANVLGEVESFVGALCSIACSLVCPVVFYTTILARRRKLTAGRMLGLGIMLVCGCLMVVIIVAEDVMALQKASAATPKHLSLAAFSLQQWSMGSSIQ